MKIRKIKILLTTREVLVTGFDKEKTNVETDAPVCPLCHSPLTAPLAPDIAALTKGETKQNLSETKNIKGREK
ncbi:MAG TPA: hypothetical protein VF599_20615 [Pyrinomonadaceae bacterium]